MLEISHLLISITKSVPAWWKATPHLMVRWSTLSKPEGDCFNWINNFSIPSWHSVTGERVDIFWRSSERKTAFKTLCFLFNSLLFFYPLLLTYSFVEYCRIPWQWCLLISHTNSLLDKIQELNVHPELSHNTESPHGPHLPKQL